MGSMDLQCSHWGLRDDDPGRPVNNALVRAFVHEFNEALVSRNGAFAAAAQKHDIGIEEAGRIVENALHESLTHLRRANDCQIFTRQKSGAVI